jgi:hypothetical protein
VEVVGPDGQSFYPIVTSQGQKPASKKFYCDEIPAGMMDGGNDLSGNMVKELFEELGIGSKTGDKYSIGGAGGSKLFRLGWHSPSGGGTDELMYTFYLKLNVTQNFIDKCEKGYTTGNTKENEKIKVKLVDREYLLAMEDAKALSALAFLEGKRDEKDTELIDYLDEVSNSDALDFPTKNEKTFHQSKNGSRSRRGSRNRRSSRRSSRSRSRRRTSKTCQ